MLVLDRKVANATSSDGGDLDNAGYPVAAALVKTTGTIISSNAPLLLKTSTSEVQGPSPTAYGFTWTGRWR